MLVNLMAKEELNGASMRKVIMMIVVDTNSRDRVDVFENC